MTRWTALLAVPMMLAVSPLVGCAVGYGVDKLFGTQPVITLIGLGLGFVAGLRETWLLIQKTSKDE